MLQLAAPAAIAAPSPVRASSLDFAAFVRPAQDVFDAPGRFPSCPFPDWVPGPEADREFADRLGWQNDSPGNDWLDGYPGPGWQDDEPDGGPTAEDEALYACVTHDEHHGCHCRMDVSRYEAFEADAWLAESLGPDWHEAELVRSGRGPLNPVVGGHRA